jgi:protein TonB
MMFWKKSEYKSTAVSIAVHLLVLALLVAFKIEPEADLNQYVTIGFGNIGKSSSAGATDKSELKKGSRKKNNPKKIEVPKARNTDKKNTAVTVNKKNNKTEVKSDNKKKKKEKKKKGKDNFVKGEGAFGFELDFGGKGKRKIYSYSLPAYPPGVSKEIDVKLRFTILPDGTVGRIIPVRKADTRLEAAAMNSLRQWRFEALPENAKQVPQIVFITFPFRLQ